MHSISKYIHSNVYSARHPQTTRSHWFTPFRVREGAKANATTGRCSYAALVLWFVLEHHHIHPAVRPPHWWRRNIWWSSTCDFQTRLDYKFDYRSPSYCCWRIGLLKNKACIGLIRLIHMTKKVYPLICPVSVLRFCVRTNICWGGRGGWGGGGWGVGVGTVKYVSPT